jgi:hypothetical protein
VIELNRTISTFEELKTWMRDLKGEDFMVDPDTHGESIWIFDTGTPAFTSEQATQYDRLWEQGYTVCADLGVDIHGVALDILHED